MRIKTWTLACSAALVSVLLTGSSSLATSAPGPTVAGRDMSNTNLDVYSFNMSGAATTETDGTIDNGGGKRAIKPVTDLLEAGGRPDLIALQEVCYNQLHAMNLELSKYGYFASAIKVRDQSRCTRNVDANPPQPELAGGMYNYVAVPAQYGPQAFNYPLGDGDDLTCLLFTKSARTIVGCSTQLSGNQETRYAKAKSINNNEVVPWIDSFNAGVVIAGDFNSEPTSSPAGASPMNWMYSSLQGGSTRGRLFEAADTINGTNPGGSRLGRWTHKARNPDVGTRKIDYIFMSDNFFKPRSFVPGYSDRFGYSYHTLYFATAAMR